MKKIILFVCCIFNIALYGQQWDWAVTADSVYGNQMTKVICKSNSDLYALIYQQGHSIINNTHLDSGNVIVKINTSGQIQWAKEYSGDIQSIYADNNGNIYFIGQFSDTLIFLNTTLISKGGTDVFYGKLSATGNLVWVSSAGGLQNDLGKGIISDAQGNIFVAGHIKNDYYVGTQLLTGYTGKYTYLIRCNLNGSHISSYADSMMYKIDTLDYINTGLNFQKDIFGNIYLSANYASNPCYYMCGGTEIIKINSLNYSLAVVAQFYAYGYEDLRSWAVNLDSTISANFNLGSHYFSSYCIMKIGPNNQRTFRKGLGNGYDGKSNPYITKGISEEIIVGGRFTNGWPYYVYDTLWYDNLFVLPDTIPNVIIGGVDISNQFTWLLHSGGISLPEMSGLISDEQGHCYTAGRYNNHYNWVSQDSLPKSITFGNTVLPAENKYTRFFVAGATTNLVTSVAENKTYLFDLSVYPNPTSGVLIINLKNKVVETRICVSDIFGKCLLTKICRNEMNPIIDLSSQSKGIYFVEIVSDDERAVKKIVLQ